MMREAETAAMQRQAKARREPGGGRTDPPLESAEGATHGIHKQGFFCLPETKHRQDQGEKWAYMILYGNMMVLTICGINRHTCVANLYPVSCSQLSFTLSPPDTVLGAGG